jgi:hypothetical protein
MRSCYWKRVRAASILTALLWVLSAASANAADGLASNAVGATQFLICEGGTNECRILVPGLRTSHEKEQDARLARRLQTYLYLLTGCKPPIDGLDASPPPPPGTYYIKIDTEVHKTARGFCYVVDIIHDLGPPYIPVRGVELVINAEGSACGEMAINELVRKHFGVDLSSIDDPRFDWSAHLRRTLAINYADFRAMRFPP